MTTSDQTLLQQVLPRYEIRDEIGRGGWGVVYEGWHRDLQRPVAIKQLPHQFGSDPSVRDRFITEAQLVGSLEHPHIVPVYDFAERDGLYVIVMEFASGGTIWQRFCAQGMAADQAVGTILAAASGLHHAHSRGLLHRDVKPDNMLYSASGTVKIADFGIAKSMSGTQAGPATEGLMGTPAYMAPEQVTGEPLSAATDVYALASVLYELLSGYLPFEATEPIPLLFQRVHEAPRPLHALAPNVPAPIASVVDRALHRAPADRPATAEQFAVELATAATQSFGTGWLERSAITVMGSTAVIGATERTSNPASYDDRSSGTVVMHPGETERLRLGEMPPTDTATHEPTPAAADPTSTAVASNPTKLRRWFVGATAVVAMIVVAFLFLGGDDVSAITVAERAVFVEQCEARDVAPGLCTCAVDRAVGQLNAETFRTGLAVMTNQDGELVDDFKEAFEICRANGF